MKKKALTVIFSTTLLICIGGNIYQNMMASKLRESLSELVNAKNELTAEIENKTTELNNVTSEIETANTTIEELTAKVDSLTSAINATQSKIDGINSTHTDIILGDDEYKGDNADIDDDYRSMYTEEENEAIDKAIDEAIDDILEEYYQSNPNQAPTTGYQGPPVGTPSTGQFQNPNYTIGESGHVEGGENATVY